MLAQMGTVVAATDDSGGGGSESGEGGGEKITEEKLKQISQVCCYQLKKDSFKLGDLGL